MRAPLTKTNVTVPLSEITLNSCTVGKVTLSGGLGAFSNLCNTGFTPAATSNCDFSAVRGGVTSGRSVKQGQNEGNVREALAMARNAFSAWTCAASIVIGALSAVTRCGRPPAVSSRSCAAASRRFSRNTVRIGRTRETEIGEEEGRLVLHLPLVVLSLQIEDGVQTEGHLQPARVYAVSMQGAERKGSIPNLDIPASASMAFIFARSEPTVSKWSKALTVCGLLIEGRVLSVKVDQQAKVPLGSTSIAQLSHGLGRSTTHILVRTA